MLKRGSPIRRGRSHLAVCLLTRRGSHAFYSGLRMEKRNERIRAKITAVPGRSAVSESRMGALGLGMASLLEGREVVGERMPSHEVAVSLKNQAGKFRLDSPDALAVKINGALRDRELGGRPRT